MKIKKQRKVLVIDDSQTNLILLKAHLNSMGLVAILTENPAEGMQIATEQRPDIILLDVMMPDIDGFEICRRLKADVRTSSIPVIFVSAKDQSEDKIFGLKLGAIDYVTKPFNKGELQVRIGIVLQMIELQERLLLLANTDELTGLSNRRHFFEILEREILQAKIRGGSVAIMMFDIDHFKNINDTYGHLCGDKVLQQVGKILHENIYPLDLAARYGGEEFVILMPGMPVDIAGQRAEKLRQIVDEYRWEIANKPISVTCSVGVTVFDGSDNTDPYELIRRADDALYAAKHRGRNCVILFDQLDPNEQVQEHQNEDFHELQTKISSLASRIKVQTIGTITAFAKAIAAKDHYLARHAENVKTYVTSIAKKMEVSHALTEQLQVAAVLHDLGKIVIPNDILHKTTALTDEEYKLVQRHPIASAEILAPVGLFGQEVVIIRHHHENFDGTGYPNGLVGKNIPIGSRIIAVADAFDVMTSNYWSDPPKTPQEAIAEIAKLANTKFDPEVIDALKSAYLEHQNDWPLAQNAVAQTPA
ncbi:MAG: diguanylate cyclase [Sedimentisphaerales bacterium]|nr:diguanylate cyclase [Sedimentisphaerales bacterium]